MSITVAGIQTYVNQYIRDTSTNSVSAADRLAAISEATKQLMTEIGLEMLDRKYTLAYLDDVNYYNITTLVPTYLEPVAVRHPQNALHNETAPFLRKDSDEFYDELENSEGNAFTIERTDRKTYLGINHESLYSALVLHNCDSLTANGTWQVGESSAANSSDAENITLDTVEFQVGTGSINFDVDVSDHAGNLGIISNEDMTAVDCTDHLDLSYLVARVYIPDVTYFSSITAYWGSSTTAYWSATVTTDIMGNAWVAGWNRIKVAWSAATMTSTPDVAAINYLRFDFNYTGSQTDDTDFRIDDILMIRPENLDFHYQSFALGETSTSVSTLVTEFGATTNVPFFSGQYDFLDVYVAHKAASILFRQMGLQADSEAEELAAEKEKKKIGKRFPVSTLKRQKNFKAYGINFRSSRRTRRIN